MARSFFERLTGSVRVNEEADEAARPRRATPVFPRSTSSRRAESEERREAVIHPTSQDNGRAAALA